MKRNCYDIGALQAFLDGESKPAEAAAIADHLIECDACALALSTAEEENSFVFTVLDREIDVLVPTHRLWTKINDSIESERSSVPVHKKIFTAIGAFFASPSLSAAAGCVLIAGLLGGFWLMRTDVADDGRAVLTSPPAAAMADTPYEPRSEPTSAAAMPREVAAVPVSRTVMPARRPAASGAVVQRASFVTPAAEPTSSRRTEALREFTAGEEAYIKTIAGLKQNVDAQKDVVLTPTARVAYERDMAVVNDAISKMKMVVKKDPENQAAKQLLFSSYQNKIDLLNSVAAREELMASLR